jgi:hypothetical protein
MHLPIFADMLAATHPCLPILQTQAKMNRTDKPKVRALPWTELTVDQTAQ